jgi:hypothetical protein
VPDSVGANAITTEALGSETSAAEPVSTTSEALRAIGSTTTYFVLTPHRMTPLGAFIHWGQTDIFFGGDEMDVSYGELD